MSNLKIQLDTAKRIHRKNIYAAIRFLQSELDRLESDNFEAMSDSVALDLIKSANKLNALLNVTE